MRKPSKVLYDWQTKIFDCVLCMNCSKLLLHSWTKIEDFVFWWKPSNYCSIGELKFCFFINKWPPQYLCATDEPNLEYFVWVRSPFLSWKISCISKSLVIFYPDLAYCSKVLIFMCKCWFTTAKYILYSQVLLIMKKYICVSVIAHLGKLSTLSTLI